MMKCLYETSLIIDGRRVREGNKLAVYDGYEKQIGPFYLQVLSPPKTLHNYLRQSGVIEEILRSKKGQTIRNYVKKLWEMLKREEQVEHREEIVSEIVERFKVDIPQEIQEKIKKKLKKMITI